jgi:hypothetical protein
VHGQLEDTREQGDEEEAADAEKGGCAPDGKAGRCRQTGEKANSTPQTAKRTLDRPALITVTGVPARLSCGAVLDSKARAAFRALRRRSLARGRVCQNR